MTATVMEYHCGRTAPHPCGRGCHAAGTWAPPQLGRQRPPSDGMSHELQVARPRLQLRLRGLVRGHLCTLQIQGFREATERGARIQVRHVPLRRLGRLLGITGHVRRRLLRRLADALHEGLCSGHVDETRDSPSSLSIVIIFVPSRDACAGFRAPRGREITAQISPALWAALRVLSDKFSHQDDDSEADSPFSRSVDASPRSRAAFSPFMGATSCPAPPRGPRSSMSQSTTARPRMRYPAMSWTRRARVWAVGGPPGKSGTAPGNFSVNLRTPCGAGRAPASACQLAGEGEPDGLVQRLSRLC